MVYCRFYRVPNLLFLIYSPKFKYMTLLVNHNLLDTFHDEEYVPQLSTKYYSANSKTKLTNLISKALITPFSERKLLAIWIFSNFIENNRFKHVYSIFLGVGVVFP